MYQIGEIAAITGISAYTLRYYEKIGILPKPKRKDHNDNGIRIYDEQDLQFIWFIHGLKETGMKLEDIAAITKDGCLLSESFPVEHIQTTLSKRMELLEAHVEQLQAQIEQLQSVKTIAEAKRAFYTATLHNLNQAGMSHERKS